MMINLKKNYKNSRGDKSETKQFFLKKFTKKLSIFFVTESKVFEFYFNN